MKEDKPFTTSFTYPRSKEEVMDELKVISIRERKSQSELIFDLIEQYVKAHSSGNDTFKLDEWNINSNFKALPATASSKEEWLQYIKENTNKEERLEILDKANYISGVIKNIFYNESLKK